MANEFKNLITIYGDHLERCRACVEALRRFYEARGDEWMAMVHTTGEGTGLCEGVTTWAFYTRGNPLPALNELAVQFPTLVFQCDCHDLINGVVNVNLQAGRQWDFTYEACCSEEIEWLSEHLIPAEEEDWSATQDSSDGEAVKHNAVEWNAVSQFGTQLPLVDEAAQSAFIKNLWKVRERHIARPLKVTFVFETNEAIVVDGDVGFVREYEWKHLHSAFRAGQFNNVNCSGIETLGFDPHRNGYWFCFRKPWDAGSGQCGTAPEPWQKYPTPGADPAPIAAL